MPIDYVVDSDRRLITVTLSDWVTGRMLSQLQQRLRKDTSIEPGFNELIEFKDNFVLDFETPLWDLANSVIPHSVDPTGCCIALVRAGPADARACRAMIAKKWPQALVEAFDDTSDALVWLCEPSVRRAWLLERLIASAKASVLYYTPLVQTQGDEWRNGLRRAQQLLELLSAAEPDPEALAELVDAIERERRGEGSYFTLLAFCARYALKVLDPDRVS